MTTFNTVVVGTKNVIVAVGEKTQHVVESTPDNFPAKKQIVSFLSGMNEILKLADCSLHFFVVAILVGYFALTLVPENNKPHAATLSKAAGVSHWKRNEFRDAFTDKVTVVYTTDAVEGYSPSHRNYLAVQCSEGRPLINWTFGKYTSDSLATRPMGFTVRVGDAAPVDQEWTVVVDNKLAYPSDKDNRQILAALDQGKFAIKSPLFAEFGVFNTTGFDEVLQSLPCSVK